MTKTKEFIKFVRLVLAAMNRAHITESIALSYIESKYKSIVFDVAWSFFVIGVILGALIIYFMI